MRRQAQRQTHAAGAGAARRRAGAGEQPQAHAQASQRKRKRERRRRRRRRSRRRRGRNRYSSLRPRVQLHAQANECTGPQDIALVRAIHGHSICDVDPARAGRPMTPEQLKLLHCRVHRSYSRHLNSILHIGLVPGGLPGAADRKSRNSSHVVAYALGVRCKSRMGQRGSQQ